MEGVPLPLKNLHNKRQENADPMVFLCEKQIKERQSPRIVFLGIVQKENEFSIAMIILLFSLCENISTLYLAEYLQQPVLDYMLKTNYAQMKGPPLQKLKNIRFFAGA